MANTVILCVDDDPTILELLTFVLEEAGFSVLLARTGLDALALAYSQKPALILLDLVLPDMPGEEVCRRLRLHSPTAKSPIIMLSVKDEEADKVMGLEIGADDYVTKPFSPRILLARIKALLRDRDFTNNP
jgi:two-component system alkaline phosphatase synthesis response regulator PhoP